MDNKPVNRSSVTDRYPSRKGIRRGLLIVILIFSVLLQGCFLDRLITLRSQTCSFDEYFAIRIDQNFVIEFSDPVLLEKDMRLVWGAAPTSISNSDTGSTMHYLFERVPLVTDNGNAPLLEEFLLDFDFIQTDGQLRLSKVSSNDLPAELLLAATTMSLSGLDEISEYACKVELNPFIRSMTLPLDKSWFIDLPSRDEHTALFGNPDSTLDDGNGLVYQYQLKGIDAEPQIARFVIWYDESGEKPVSVEAGFSRYQMHTDLRTALMEVRFKI